MQQKPDERCLNAALRLLTRRDHGCAELSKKLEQRGFGSQDIKRTINECIRLSYLDDERFSLNFLRQLVRKGCGPRQIQQRLRLKGIPGPIIDEVLVHHFPAPLQEERCRMTAHKKLASAAFGSKPGKLKVRLYRFLFGRGFQPEVIRKVLEDLSFEDEGC
jgi:regulatory protein